MGKLIGGGVFVFVGLFMLAGAIINIAEGDSGLVRNLAVLAVFGGVPLGVGSLLIRSHFKTKQHALQEKRDHQLKKWEKEIIRLAQHRDGRLTIPDIVAETSMDSEEADEVMREMASNGYVNMQVTDSGVIVYEFYEIAHRNQDALGGA